MSASVARNPRLVCVFEALKMALFPVAVITLFWQDVLDMSMHEVFVLQGVFGLSIAVFEFPSGYLADRLGYRRTLVAASALTLAGWCAYAAAGSFTHVLVAELVMGVGLSLVSGTDSALLFESLSELGRSETYRVWDGRRRFVGQSAEALAALGAGVMYVWWERLPFVLEIAMWAAALVVALRFVEPARPRPQSGGHLVQMTRIARRILGGEPRLAAVVFATLAFSLSSFVPVWIVPLYAREAGVPDAWIGPIWAVANFVVAFGALGSDRIVRRTGLLPALLGCVTLVAVGYGGLVATTASFGFAFYFAICLMRGVNGPALLHEEQALIPSSDRAGYLSFRSLLFRLVFFGLSLFLGSAVDEHGFRPVLLTIGAGAVGATLVGVLALASVRRT